MAIVLSASLSQGRAFLKEPRLCRVLHPGLREGQVPLTLLCDWSPGGVLGGIYPIVPSGL